MYLAMLTVSVSALKRILNRQLKFYPSAEQGNAMSLGHLSELYLEQDKIEKLNS